MVVYIGVDDAGRGPVIGPMILAGVMIKPEKEEWLREMGVKDSKELIPSKRKKIKEELVKSLVFSVQKAMPEEIDSSPNLNHLEAQKMAMVINELSQKTDEKIVAQIDCPSINTVVWREYLRMFLVDKDRIELVVEHKADVKFPAVSAASIIAKEERENEVRKIKQEIGKDFGSGYPSDPKTKEFLKENMGDETIDKFIRHSWSTVKKLGGENSQKKLF